MKEEGASFFDVPIQRSYLDNWSDLHDAYDDRWIKEAIAVESFGSGSAYIEMPVDNFKDIVARQEWGARVRSFGQHSGYSSSHVEGILQEMDEDTRLYQLCSHQKKLEYMKFVADMFILFNQALFQPYSGRKVGVPLES